MPSFKAAQKIGGQPTVTPEYLTTARAPDAKTGKQKIPDSMIAEQIAASGKDKDFTTMWAKRRAGGDEAAKSLLNYYTYGDPKGPAVEENTVNANYQFTQNDAAGYFDNPDEVLAQLKAMNGPEKRQPMAFGAEGMMEGVKEHPITGTIAAGLGFASNAVTSTINMGKDVVQAAAHPKETLSGMMKGATGVAELGYEAITGNQIPQFNPDGTKTRVDDTENQQMAKDIWNEIVVKRFGGLEDFLPGGDKPSWNSLSNTAKTIYEDPASIVADVLAVLGGAGTIKNLAKTGKISKAGKINTLPDGTPPGGASPTMMASPTVVQGAETAGAMGVLGKMVKAPVRGAQKLVQGGAEVSKDLAGYATGAGRGAIDETLRTARFGTPEGIKAMNEGVKAGSINEANVLDDVLNNINTLREKRATEYRAKLEQFDGAKELLNGGPVAEAIGNSMGSFKIMGGPGKLDFSMSAIPAGTQAAKEISAYLDELASWGHSPGQNFDAIGFDTLKKRLSALYPEDPKARAFVTPIQDAIVKVLDDVPGYKEMTTQYRELTETLDDVRKTLAVGGKASSDTAIRKLTNLLKNNHENKADVLRALLGEAGDTTTMPKIAGVAMSPKFPRGLQGVMAATAVSLSAWDLGRLAGRLSTIILSSPRTVHEFLKVVGLTQRQIDKVVELGKKAGANKLFQDKTVGAAAELSRLKVDSDKKKQVEDLFPYEAGQNE